MVGVVIATHGPLAQALADSAGLIMGQSDSLKCIGLFHGDDIDTYMERVKDTIIESNTGEGVIVFTDMYGGSPSNAAALAINELKHSVAVKCVLGVNLPMILETLGMRHSLTLDELSNYIIETGKSAIDEITNKLRGE